MFSCKIVPVVVSIFFLVLNPFAVAQTSISSGGAPGGALLNQTSAPAVRSDTASDAPTTPADPLAKSLKLTTDSKSLPLWSKPDATAASSLAQIVRHASPAIFLVGKSDVGTGTAFLISKKNRLLATNAHVGDIFNKGSSEMLAYQNNTSNAFKVIKVYYHPGVLRMSQGVVLRTANPDTGNVYTRSPDVAVLQLADGPELPDELPLASREEVYDLFAQPVAMLGYPGLDTVSLPTPGHKAEASFREGVISRVADFANDAGAEPERQQYLQHSMASWFGFSGSAIFLPNGHVVALNNSGGTYSYNGLTTTLAWGIRSDCLWELLKANKLLDKVNVPPEASSVDIDRFSQPDPEVEKLQKADQLLADAKIDLKFSRYDAALEKCNEAAKQMPYYARVYGIRGSMYLDIPGLALKHGDPKRRQYFQLALEDENKALQLDPSNADYYLEVATANCNLANNSNPAKPVVTPEAIQIADKLINDSSVSATDRVFAYRVRAHGMGFSSDSLPYLKKADSISPSDFRVKWSLAIYYAVNKDSKESARQKALSETLREVSAKSDTAFLLAASRDKSKRDGKRAVELATQACVSTDYKCYYALSGLATAYAERGDFDHAIEYQKKALQLAPEHRRTEYTKRLTSFQELKPWRI
jgi:tetratricopeptide (TPR) repeat protein